ncbi:MAG TPA: helix-turn-helix domain-containing protein [Nitrospira sp.]|nr:helix-turn-helix domain-containing protein [Nitrospira sp.]
MDTEDPQLVPVKDAATVLNVSPFALYRKLRAGEIPGYRFGRKVLLDLREVRDAMRVKPPQRP